MSTAQAILRSYRAPRQVMDRHLDEGAGEPRALIWVMVACLLLFVAQLPQLSRDAHLNPEGPPFEALAGGALLGSLFIAPLVFYGIAAVSRLVASLFGGSGTFLTARLALFWGLLAAAPLALLRGLVAGFIGPGPALTFTSLAAFVAFLAIWLICLIHLERTYV